MKRTVWAGVIVMLAASLSIVVVALPVQGAPVEASTASAFGVRAHATLLGRDAVNVPPFPYVSAPDPSAEDPDNVSDSIVGPYRYPDNGSLVSNVRVLGVDASRTSGSTPTAHAESQVTGVALLETAGVPLISADVIHAVSDSKCTGPNRAAVSAEGSRIVGLKVGTLTYNYVPEPNTTIPLVYDPGTPADGSDDRGVKVILNEQTGASRGAGLIVTMIHVIVFDAASPNLVFADVKIAEARSSVWCGDATPPTNDNGDDRGVESDKVATSTTSDVAGATDGTQATAYRGDQVTWTITLSNKGTTGCSLLVVTDTLPRHFTFVSTSGDLSEGDEDPDVDGQTITWSNPARYDLPAGGSLKQTIVAKVSDDAPYGTYTNLVDVEESTCSSFTQGLRGPVEVIPREARVLPGRITRPPAAPLPATGAGLFSPLLGALGLLTAGAMSLRLSKSR